MGKHIKQDEDLRWKYRCIRVAGKKIDEHRHIMEEKLGRKLLPTEIVHHIDGNKLNNDPSNLMLMSRAAHARLHKQGVPNTQHANDRIRETTKKRWHEGELDFLKKPVIAYDKVTGAFCARFSCIGDAERSGYTRTHIAACCKGKRKTHKGLIWKYE